MCILRTLLLLILACRLFHRWFPWQCNQCNSGSSKNRLLRIELYHFSGSTSNNAGTAKSCDSDSTIPSSKDVGIDTNVDKQKDKYRENVRMIQHPTLISDSNYYSSYFPPIYSYDAEACPRLITVTMMMITMQEEEEGLSTSWLKYN